MFLGHHAAGLALSRTAPRVSLGWWIGAALWLDLLWAPLLALRVERVAIEPGASVVTPLTFLHYPWSHSLVAAAGWALLAAAGGRLLFRRWRVAAALAGAVLSHWALDAVSHAPDLPLWPGGPLVGLGLWNSLPATILLEGGLFVFAAALYLRGTTPESRFGRYGAWSYLAFVGLIGIGAWFGPPPPDTGAIVWTGLASWLFPLWAWDFDRNRQPNSSSTGA